MLKQINKEHRDVETICESVALLCSAIDSDTPVNESQTNLKSVIKKILVTNKEIPTTLATVIARTIVFSEIIQDFIDRKKRYKKHTLLKKVYDHITDVTATKLQPATDEQIDNVAVDILAITKDIVASITGKSEVKDDIQSTFDNIINRLTTVTTERNRLSVMKLSSLIVQSNQDTRKRKDIINQYLREGVK